MKEDLEGNIEEMKKYLKKLDESGLYDAEKYSRSFMMQRNIHVLYYIKQVSYLISIVHL